MKRRGLFASLALFGMAAPAMLALAVPAQAALPVIRPESGEDPALEEAQYRGRGRGRRCRWETRQVRVRDRWGRVRWRTVRREVCW